MKLTFKPYIDNDPFGIVQLGHDFVRFNDNELKALLRARDIAAKARKWVGEDDDIDTLLAEIEFGCDQLVQDGGFEVPGQD